MCHENDRVFGDDANLARVTLRHQELRQSDSHITPVLSVVPKGSTKGIVLLVLDAIGMSPFYTDVAVELAGHGYEVLVPDFFSRLPPLADAGAAARRTRRREHLDEPRIIADFAELADHCAHDDLPVAVVGFCLGGMFALTIAARVRRLCACVTFYGYVNGQPGRSLVDNPSIMDEADRLDLPMLLHWGTADADAYDQPTIEKFVAVTSAAGGRPRVAAYPDATHAFLKAVNDDQPSPNRSAATEAWAATIRFLGDTVADPVRRV
jgi:carboxymethylenebutenolidase